MPAKINFNNFKLIQPEILLHIPTGKIFKISGLVKELLQNINIKNEKSLDNTVKELSKKWNIKEIREVIQELSKLEKQFKEREKLEEEVRLSFTAICLLVSQRCNFKCTYCYGEGGSYRYKGRLDMDFNTAKQAIRFLIKYSDRSRKVLGVNFFGGEPLMNFELIKKIVKYCRDIEKTEKIKFSFSITTNGSLCSPHVADYFKKNNFLIVLSIDGPSYIHNKFRKFKNNKPTFEKVKKGLLNLINKRNKKINLRVTYQLGSCKLMEIISYLKRFKVRSVNVAEIQEFYNMRHKFTYYNLKTLEKDYKIVFDKCISEPKFNRILEILPNNWAHFLEAIHFRYLKRYYCGAMRKFVAVACNGDIYPCHRFVGIEEWKIGNVKESDIEINDKIRAFWVKVDQKSKCKECWARYYCGGGCLYLNWIKTGDINIPNENHCVIHKFLFKKSAEVYSNLDKKEKEKLTARAKTIVKLLKEQGSIPNIK